MRGSWRPNRNFNILTPNLWPATLCLSRSPNVQPEAQSPLCWVMAFFIASYQQFLWSPNSIRFPEGPLGRVWFYVPHIVFLRLQLYCNCNSNSTATALYNSSIPTQSPTRLLESHVGSSSSGNNCHAVHRSLSSGASVYECTMGIFLPRPISSANFRPRDFLS